MNCVFYIDSYNSHGSTLNILFGDIPRNITIKFSYISLSKQENSYYKYLCFIQNPIYEGDNILELLDSVRNNEKRYWKHINKSYGKSKWLVFFCAKIQ